MPDGNDFHEDFSRHEKIEGSSDRGFGFVFAAFFALVGAIALWNESPRWIWWTGIAVVILLIALLRAKLLAPFNWLWTKLGLVLFTLISPLMLGVIYFIIMTPIGMLLRIFKKDILRRRFDPDANSYWIHREPPGPDPDSMINQF